MNINLTPADLARIQAALVVLRDIDANDHPAEAKATTKLLAKLASETKREGYPADYDDDTGVAMVFDTLCDRGHDSDEVAEALDGFDGDLWNDVFGPAVDNAAELIGLSPYPEED